MPKIKTHSGAKKRFKLTKNGQVKSGPAYHRQRRTQKSTKLKRGMRKNAYADKTNAAAVKAMLPYA